MPENGRSAIVKLPRRKFLSLAGMGAIAKCSSFSHIPLPLFALFQNVYTECPPDDDEFTVKYWGTVEGVVYNPESWRSKVGWVYFCRWQRVEPNDCVGVNHLDQVPERELIAYAGRL